MGSPVSIGDIIALGATAWKIGQALTNGRKGAPAEFRAVGNQLFSLKTALDLLQQSIKDGEIRFTVDEQKHPGLEDGQASANLDQMIRNCIEAMAVVNDELAPYVDSLGGGGSGTGGGGIGGIGVGPGGVNFSGEGRTTGSYRLKRLIRDNYKKIKWTTAGGDITALKSELVIHTQGIQLLVTTAASQAQYRARKASDDNFKQVFIEFSALRQWHERSIQEQRTFQIENMQHNHQQQYQQQQQQQQQQQPQLQITGGQMGYRSQPFLLASTAFDAPELPYPVEEEIYLDFLQAPAPEREPIYARNQRSPPPQPRTTESPHHYRADAPPVKPPKPGKYVEETRNSSKRDAKQELRKEPKAETRREAKSELRRDAVLVKDTMKRKSRATDDEITFELCSEVQSSDKKIHFRVICPNASLRGNWRDCTENDNAGNEMFVCLCESWPEECDDSEESEQEPHEPHDLGLKGFYMTRKTLPIKYHGKAKWVIYNIGKRGTDRSMRLGIRSIRPRRAQFERTFVEPLTLLTAKEALSRKESSQFVYVLKEESLNGRIAILSSIAENTDFHRELKSVTFAPNGSSREVEHSNVTFVNLYHYKTIASDTVSKSKKLVRDAFKYNETVELVVNFRADGRNPVTLQIQVGENELDDVSWAVNCKTVEILAKRGHTVHPTGKSKRADISGPIKFDFSTNEAAVAFKERLEDMKDELHALKIQHPTTNEHVMVKIVAGDIMVASSKASGSKTGKIRIPDVEIVVAYSNKRKKGRLLARAMDGSVYVAQNLPQEFFSGFASLSKKDLFVGAAEYVQNVGRRNIRKEPQGIGSLDFLDPETQQLFYDKLTEAARRHGIISDEEVAPARMPNDFDMRANSMVLQPARPVYHENSAAETPISTEEQILRAIPKSNLARPMDAEELFNLFKQTGESVYDTAVVQDVPDTPHIQIDLAPDLSAQETVVDSYFPAPSLPEPGLSAEDLMRRRGKKSHSRGRSFNDEQFMSPPAEPERASSPLPAAQSPVDVTPVAEISPKVDVKANGILDEVAKPKDFPTVMQPPEPSIDLIDNQEDAPGEAKNLVEPEQNLLDFRPEGSSKRPQGLMRNAQLNEDLLSLMEPMKPLVRPITPKPVKKPTISQTGSGLWDPKPTINQADIGLWDPNPSHNPYPVLQPPEEDLLILTSPAPPPKSLDPVQSPEISQSPEPIPSSERLKNPELLPTPGLSKSPEATEDDSDSMRRMMEKFSPDFFRANKSAEANTLGTASPLALQSPPASPDIKNGSSSRSLSMNSLNSPQSMAPAVWTPSGSSHSFSVNQSPPMSPPLPANATASEKIAAIMLLAALANKKSPSQGLQKPLKPAPRASPDSRGEESNGAHSPILDSHNASTTLSNTSFIAESSVSSSPVPHSSSILSDSSSFNTPPLATSTPLQNGSAKPDDSLSGSKSKLQVDTSPTPSKIVSHHTTMEDDMSTDADEDGPMTPDTSTPTSTVRMSTSPPSGSPPRARTPSPVRKRTPTPPAREATPPPTSPPKVVRVPTPPPAEPLPMISSELYARAYRITQTDNRVLPFNTLAWIDGEIHPDHAAGQRLHFARNHQHGAGNGWVGSQYLKEEKYYQVTRRIRSSDLGNESVKFREKSLVVILDRNVDDNPELVRVVPLGGNYTAILPIEVLREVQLCMECGDDEEEKA